MKDLWDDYGPVIVFAMILLALIALAFYIDPDAAAEGVRQGTNNAMWYAIGRGSR